jgi:hypothetical protein
MAAQLPIQLERIRYWQGQLLSAGDLQTQLRVDEELRRLHNRAAHRAYGIAIGLGHALEALGDAQERTKRAIEIDNGKLKLPCGLAYDCAGRALIVSTDRIVDLPPHVTNNLTLVLSYDPNAVDGVALNWKPAQEVNPGIGVAITSLLTGIGGSTIDLDFRPVVARPVARPRMATGNTIPGATSWQSWKIGDTEVGVQVLVDTSAVGFTRTPHFFAEALSGKAAEDLRGQSALRQKPVNFVPAWFASIAYPSTQGFTFQLMLRRITRESLEIADPKRQVVETPKLDQKLTLNGDGNNALVIGDRIARLLPIGKRASVIKTLTKSGGVATLEDALDNQLNPMPVAFGHAPRITKVVKVSEPKSFFEVTVDDPKLFLENLVVVKMAAPPANSRPARIVSAADDGTLELTAQISGLAIGDSLGIVNRESAVQKIDGLKLEVANPNLFTEGDLVVRMGETLESSASSTIEAKAADGTLTLSVAIKGLEVGSSLGVAGEGGTVQDIEQNAKQVEVEVESPKLFIKGDLVTKSPGSGMFVPVRVERVFATQKKLALSGPILGLAKDDFIVAADFPVRATIQGHSNSILMLREATRFPNDSHVAVIDELLKASLPAVVANSQLSVLTLAAPLAGLNDGDVIGLCSFPSSFEVKDIRPDKSIVVSNAQLLHEGDILSALPLRTGLAMVASINGDVIRLAGEIPNLAIGDRLWETTIDGAIKATPSAADPKKTTVETPERLRVGDFLADIQGWRQAWPGFTATSLVDTVTPTEITLGNQPDGLLMYNTIGLATITPPFVELRLNNTMPSLRRGDEVLLVGTDRLAGDTQSLFASVFAVITAQNRVILRPEQTLTAFAFRPEDLYVGVLFVHGSALALIQQQDLFVSWLAVGEPDEMPKPCGTGAKEPESECTPA